MFTRSCLLFSAPYTLLLHMFVLRQYAPPPTPGNEESGAAAPYPAGGAKGRGCRPVPRSVRKGLGLPPHTPLESYFASLFPIIPLVLWRQGNPGGYGYAVALTPCARAVLLSRAARQARPASP